MMLYETNNKDFDRINELYTQYVELVEKQADDDFQKKWKVAYKTVRDKLIISVCKFYFNFEIKEGSNKFIPAVTTENKKDDNFSDVVVEEIIRSMNSYEDSDSKNKGLPFSVFVCTNVRQAKGKALSKKIVSDNHGGSAISDYEATMVRKILKKDKELEKFEFFDEDKKNIKISKILGISLELVLKYKALGKNNTTDIERKSPKDDKDKVYFVTDVEENLTDENFLSPESIFFDNDLKEKFPFLMKEIDLLFSKKSDTKTSDVLTVAILKPFEHRKEEMISNKLSLTEFYPDVYALLKTHNFISKEILISFFENPNFNLPSQQMLADKYDLDKSAITQTIKRFRNKLLSNKEIAEYFSDFF